MCTSRDARFRAGAGRRRGWMLPVVALPCLLSACSGGSGARQDLGTLLVDHVPGQSYVLDQAVSGPLGMEQASTATPMDPGQLARALAGAQYQAGYGRAWQAGTAYATAMVLQFPGVQQARAVVAAERAYLQTALGVVVTDDAAIPGAWTYILYGDTRAGSRGVFCQGEWLVAGRYAATATTCAAHPGDVSLVREMASVEDALLVHAPGGGTPSGAATPGTGTPPA